MLIIHFRKHKDIPDFFNYFSILINRLTSNITNTLVDNELVNHSDVVGASAFSTASTTSSFSTEHQGSMDLAKTTATRGEKH